MVKFPHQTYRNPSLTWALIAISFFKNTRQLSSETVQCPVYFGLEVLNR